MGVSKLKELLSTYDNAYYNNDESLISDAEYDALKAKYLEESGLDEYDYVPGEAVKGSGKITHSQPILSLAKVQITHVERMEEELRRLWPVVIQPKFDGLTLVSYGLEEKYATRGNGLIGEDVTANVKAGVFGLGETGETVRGEVLMPLHVFEELNTKRVAEGKEPFKNPRNAAAGMLRNKDVSKVEGLHFYAYDIVAPEGKFTYAQTRAILGRYGFNVTSGHIPNSVEEAIEYILSFDRSTLDYEIDGLVAKHTERTEFGTTSHSPKNSFAIKFEQTGVWTKLIRIRHQVGRSGKCTPVADFETVEILGADVSKASLHNQGILEGLELDTMYVMADGMGEDIYVKVIKANEIIPQIIDVRFENKDKAHKVRLKEISKCPECKSELIKENEQHFCINALCPAKVVGALVHMAKRDALDIAGLSEETAVRLVNYYKQDRLQAHAWAIEDKDEEFAKLKIGEANNIHPTFVFVLGLADFESLPGFAKKSAKNLYNAINGSKEVTFDRFIYASGMPLIGRSVSKLIVEHYRTVEAFASDSNNNFSTLEKVNGIGTEIINSLNANYESMLMPFGDYDFKIEEPKEIVEIQGGKNLKIVITGKFEISRSEIKTLIEGLGSKVTGSVSNATDYLLASTGEESTSKYKKAKELGVKIVNSISDLKERL